MSARLVPALRLLLLALAGTYAAAFLAVAAARMTWPFELEWMEGGMLTHAVRLRMGQPIYAPPSADFVPFFYTPLYPAVLAALASLGLPLGFGLGRFVSFASTLATMALLYVNVEREVRRGQLLQRDGVREPPHDSDRDASEAKRALRSGRLWGLFAVGFYAALFRFAGAFYDLARPDALSLALAIGAATIALGLRAPSGRSSPPERLALLAQGDAGAALAGVILVAAFFAKQTAAVFAPALALILLARSVRLAVVFTVVVSAVGATAVAWSDHATGGWFWFYVFQGHQGHRFLWGNFWLEYWRDVLFLAPALLLVPLTALTYGWITGALALGWFGLLAAAFVQRASTLHYEPHMYYRELWYESPRVAILVPPLAVALLLTGARGVAAARRSSTVAEGERRGILPIRTSSPLTTGAPTRLRGRWLGVLVSPAWLVLAGAGAMASDLNHSTQWAYANCFMPIAIFATPAVTLATRAFVDAGGVRAILATAALVMQFVALAYAPWAQVPSRADAAALAQLRRRLSPSDGPWLIPAHPFLAYELNGTVHLHQMGIGDVAFNGGIADLSRRLARGEWRSAVVDESMSVPDLDRVMYLSDRFSYADDELFSRTGFRVRPLTLWRLQDPIERALAPGISGNFEGGQYRGWTAHGDAFARGPATRAELAGLGGLQGNRAASTRGSAGAGSLESEPFVLGAPRLTMLVAGTLGTYARATSGGEEIARVQPNDTKSLTPRNFDLDRWVGKTIRVEIVDEVQTAAAGDSHPGIVVDDLRVTW